MCVVFITFVLISLTLLFVCSVTIITLCWHLVPNFRHFYPLCLFCFHFCQYNWNICDCHTIEMLISYKNWWIIPFLHKELAVPSQNTIYLCVRLLSVSSKTVVIEPSSCRFVTSVMRIKSSHSFYVFEFILYSKVMYLNLI